MRNRDRIVVLLVSSQTLVKYTFCKKKEKFGKISRDPIIKRISCTFQNSIQKFKNHRSWINHYKLTSHQTTCVRVELFLDKRGGG